MSLSTVPDDLLRRLRAGNRYLISSHSNPDGDALGSQIGLARVLRRLGKSATIWNADPPPTIYRPLPGVDRIRVGSEPPPGFPDSFDLTVILECPSLDRTGLEDHLDGLDLLNIDHHLGNQHYGVVNWVDTSAPAVGEMVFRIAKALKVDLDAETATALYLTLVTDTGGFRFANTSPTAFAAAAALTEVGAEPTRVSRWLYESNPVGKMRLLGEMLQTLELHADGRIAIVKLTQDMYARTNSGPPDSEGLIDYPRSIAGVEAVALLRELKEGGCKASLRSHGDVDVEILARSHGGGGHRNAAGFTAAGDLSSTLSTVVEGLTGLLSRETET